MNGNEDALARATRELAEEIDRMVVDNSMLMMLDNLDWTITSPLPYMGSEIADVMAWVHQNATGDYKYVGRRMVFEHEADAVAFLLKWR
jgi:hypothetical protein